MLARELQKDRGGVPRRRPAKGATRARGRGSGKEVGPGASFDVVFRDAVTVRTWKVSPP